MLKVKAQAYLIEGANARHEHEVAVWEKVKLPAGKILIPGVVTHSTDVVEHPELVSQRLQRYARLVGKENVIAGTDCGFGGRSHPQIAWAKLRCVGRRRGVGKPSAWGSRRRRPAVLRKAASRRNRIRAADQNTVVATAAQPGGTRHGYSQG